MKLTKDAKDWYKMYTVHAAVLLVALETIQALDIQDLPSWVSIGIAVMIPVLRVIDQDNIKEAE